MKKRMLPLLAPTLLLLAVVLAGCNKDETDANQLPDGKYPLTLTATVQGLTATRATVDGAWTGGEEVAISVDGGINHKVYRVKNADGDMEPKSPGDGFYWQNKTPLDITAWHPADFNIASIKNQNMEGVYEKLDFLHATLSNLAFNATAQLSFTHCMAKVTANLHAGTGFSSDDLSDAVVQFYGYTTADVSLLGGTLSNPGTSGWITAKKGSATTYTALLIPQPEFPASTPFIHVTIGGRTYSYTPTVANHGNTLVGKANTYNITVKKSGLEVSASTSGEWAEGGDWGAGTPTDQPTFRVTIPIPTDLSGVTVDGATKVTNKPYYEVENNAATFSISYTVSDYREVEGFPVVQGLCDVTRTLEADGKYKFTYTNIRSDLKLAYDFYCQLGDFYCKDAEGSAYIIPGNIPTEQFDDHKDACLGIVLKGGKDTVGDWKDDCKYKLKNGTTPMTTIRGYVLALHDANGGIECNWGSYGTSVGHPDMNREEKTGFYGYKNTNAIKAFAESRNDMTLNTAFPATYYATDAYEKIHPAPANSSGWFLPSAGQGQYWFNHRGVILASVNKATGESYSWKNKYWSSSEYVYSPESFAWIANFSDGYMGSSYKSNGNYVRGVFAF